MKYLLGFAAFLLCSLATASFFVPPHGITLPMHQPGEVLMWGGSSCPTGTLPMNGGGYSTSAPYAALYAILGYTYGGSGGTFNVPNTGGVFIRGSGSQTIGPTLYSGTRGTAQNDHFASHIHNVYGGSAGSTYTTIGNVAAYGIGGSSGGTGYQYYTTVPAGPGTNEPFIQATGVGTETQPANIVMLYCIVY